MLRYAFSCLTGHKDNSRIDQINHQLLFQMPPVTTGTLYLDGEGTASAYVAKRGAELFLAGTFNQVVITGGRVPANDIKRHLVFPRLKKDGLKLPQVNEREAEYIERLFRDEIGDTRTPIFLERNATNASQKFEGCAHHLQNSELIQIVTLAYGQYRVLGTARKVLGDSPALAVDGVYPLGITKDNWHDWFLSYGIVMDEADKALGNDNKPPQYQRFFTNVDWRKESGRAQSANELII